MYEQWVLIQLLAALRDSGLRSDPADQLIREVARSQFTLDFEPGSEFLFHARDGQVVRVRYEPWIPTRAAARQAGETVYRNGAGEDWSPDILIEVLQPGPEALNQREVEYAVVIDAKYSSHIRDEQWESTRKYFLIHEAKYRRAIVRQVWLAHPGDAERLRPRDPGIRWYDDGPDIGWEESLHGTLELLPDPEFAEERSVTTPAQPLPVMRAFVRGLLSFLDFVEAHEPVIGKETHAG